MKLHNILRFFKNGLLSIFKRLYKNHPNNRKEENENEIKEMISLINKITYLISNFNEDKINVCCID